MTTRRVFGITAAVCVLLLVGTTSALASGLHFKSGPVWGISGTTVSASGEVAGAGTSIDASLTASYTFTVQCKNPGVDAGPVPGKSGSGTTSGDTGPIQTIHGNAPFDVSTTPATPDTSKSCKAGWTATTPVITFTTATLTITSTNGGTLTATHTF